MTDRNSSDMADDKTPSMHDVKEKHETFERILKKIEDKRLSLEDLDKLKSIERILRQKTTDKLGLYVSIYVVVVALLFGTFFFNGLHTTDGMTNFILDYYEVPEEQKTVEECLVEMTELAVEMFRPPTDCSICKNMTEVPKLEKTSVDYFEQTHAYSGRPVVIVDGTRNWTAPEVFNFKFFKHLYPEDSPVMGDQCQFFPYRTSFESLSEVFNMTEDRANLKDGSKPWYIGWSNCDQEATDVLRRHYKRPYFLPPESESSKTDWIFMGAPGYGAHMHIDHVGNPSWQAQIKGHKKWTLEPPPECYSECQTLDVTVNPGEIIVLDTNRWFHKTLVLGDSISITIGSEYD